MVYRPTARVLTILELLQSHGRMTGPELARRLEVNIRTIRDYIEMLLELGIPVEAERGRYGGYRLRPGYRLPPLIFTEDEALALTLSLLMARQNGLATVDSAFEGVLAKVERVLPVATRERIQAVEQAVLFENADLRVAPAVVAVAVLSMAVQNERCVRLAYCSARSEITERLFSPYGIVSHEGIWYTIGYCHLRRDQRLLRLDRIQHIEATTVTFARPTDFDALAEIRLKLASVPRVWRYEVWLEATLEEAQRATRLSKGHFALAKDGVLIHGEVEDLPWLARLLAGLGIPFLIHYPAELRDIFRQYALTMMSYAERTTGASPAQGTRAASS